MSRKLARPRPVHGRVVPLLIGSLLLSACAAWLNLYARIDRALEAGQPAEGVAVVQRNQSTYGSRSEVLYLMDLGMLQHLAGQFEESNQSLMKAEDLSEALYTRRISAEVEAFLTTDNALPYEGEEFEKVMLNVFMAMNYAHLGLLDEALVEARKIDHKLSVLNDRNEGKMAYTKDPLARYLSGILYEATGDLSNALVAYRLAHDAFQQAHKAYGSPIPDLLGRDLLRLSETLGLTDEHQEYRRQFPGLTWTSMSETRDFGELVLVSYEGRAPLKHDVFIDVPFSRDALGVVLATKVVRRRYREDRAAVSVLYGLTGHIIRLAVPQFVPRQTHTSEVDVIVTGPSRHAIRLSMMENVTAIAVKDLDERIVRTTAKAVARAAWKYALAEGVELGVRNAVGKHKEGGAVAGAIVGAVARGLAIASEEADKRSWATLPDRIELGRVSLPPGTYDVELRFAGRGGHVIQTHTLQGVIVKPGEKRFISQRVLQ